MENQTLLATAEQLLRHSPLLENHSGLAGEDLPELDELEFETLLNAFLGELPEQFRKQICKARSNKLLQQQKQTYWAKVEYETNAPSTINDFKREIVRRGKQMAEMEGWVGDFVIDETNREIYRALSDYFFGNEAWFEEKKLNPHKGLLLFGNVGCGKSVLMRLFQKNPVQCYSFVSCRTVESDFDRDGVDAMLKYSNLSIMVNPTQNYGQNVRGYAFDDLGTENDARHFGKIANTMESVIYNRYDNIAITGPFTHLTTNLSESEIEERYGVRVLDRFRQMFNLIKFPSNAKSRRK